jgi:hypothetical protein
MYIHIFGLKKNHACAASSVTRDTASFMLFQKKSGPLRRLHYLDQADLRPFPLGLAEALSKKLLSVFPVGPGLVELPAAGGSQLKMPFTPVLA